MKVINRGSTVDSIILEHRMRLGQSEEKHLNYSFSLSNTVFSPAIAPSGRLGLSFSCMQDFRNLKILDIGCGGGIIAALMALNGASKIVGIDINPSAISDAKLNAKAHGIEDRTDFRVGNLLAPLHRNESFDVIYADLPFTDGLPKDMLESAFYDPGLRSVKTLIKTIPAFPGLQNSRIFLAIDATDYELIRHLADRSHYSCRSFLKIDLPWISLRLLELKL